MKTIISFSQAVAGFELHADAPYVSARWLNPEARAFLAAILRHTLQGKRDFALFLAYLLTGHRNDEFRDGPLMTPVR